MSITIRREIEVKRKGLPVVIDVTYGTDLIQMEFKVTDCIIPTESSAVAYSQGRTAEVHKQICTIDENVISFTPEKSFFEEGRNELQLRVVHNNRSLFTFKCRVECQGSFADSDAEEVKRNSSLVEQLMTEQAVTKARLEEVLKLPEDGSDVEKAVNDIKVGADGKVYPSPGEAVRQQIGQVSQQIVDVKETLVNYEDVFNGEKLILSPIYEHGSLLTFNVGAKAVVNTESPYGETRQLCITEGVNLEITIEGNYSANILTVDDNETILTSSGYVKSLSIDGKTKIYLVLKDDNDSDISSVNANTIVTIKSTTGLQDMICEVINEMNVRTYNTTEFDFEDTTIEYEMGSLMYFDVGVDAIKNNVSPYNKTRIRTYSAILINANTVINIASGYSMNVIGVNKARITSVSGYVSNFTVPNDGYYWIVVKANDESDVSNVSGTNIVSFSPEYKIVTRIDSDADYETLKSKGYNTFIDRVEYGILKDGEGTPINRFLKNRQYSNLVYVPCSHTIKAISGYEFIIHKFNIDGEWLEQSPKYMTEYTVVGADLGLTFRFIIKKIDNSDFSGFNPNVILIDTSKHHKRFSNPIPDLYYPREGLAKGLDGTGDINHDDINPTLITEWYTDLVNRFPDYVHADNMGKDQSGQYDMPIYVFRPEKMELNNWKKAEWQPTIILRGGCHGNGSTDAGDQHEMIYASYLFFKELCENWRNDTALEFIRWNVTIVFMPMQNPWGIANRKRKNSRGIDLVHNFDWQFNPDFVPHDANNWGGLAPNSERETINVVNMFRLYPDAIADCDIHTTGGYPSQNRMIYFDCHPNSKMLDVARGVITQLSHVWDNKGYEGLQQMNFHGFVDVREVTNGMHYGERIGIPTCIFEGFPNFTESGIAPHKKQFVEMGISEIGNVILHIIRHLA